MAYSDDLDDFDSELEITLKREYSTVFPLFKYCVITQEATYLCNKLDMDAAPHTSFLLYEIRMEDVWVWDRNRPTRIIPRAQIYTTSDVTVEQLKEGDDAEFDAAVPGSVVEQLRAAAGIDDDDDEEEDDDEALDVVDAPSMRPRIDPTLPVVEPATFAEPRSPLRDAQPNGEVPSSGDAEPAPQPGSLQPGEFRRTFGDE